MFSTPSNSIKDMTQRFNPIPSSVTNGNQSFSAYFRNGVLVKSEDLKEVIILKTPAITGNQTYLVRLSEVGYPIKLESLWLDAPVGNNPQITVLVKRNGITMYTFTLSKDQTPYTFPFVILTPDINLEITPSTSVSSITIFATQAAVLEEPRI